MKFSRCIHLLLVTCFLGSLSGCFRLSPTTRFYHQVTTQIYPSKPKEFPIPLFNCAPDRNFKVIGRFTFHKSFVQDIAGKSFQNGYDYMICAVKYNARREGADAVIMLEDSQSCAPCTIVDSPSSVSVSSPPTKAELKALKESHTQYQPSSPDITPATTHVGFTVTRYVDAQMIVFY